MNQARIEWGVLREEFLSRFNPICEEAKKSGHVKAHLMGGLMETLVREFVAYLDVLANEIGEDQ